MRIPLVAPFYELLPYNIHVDKQSYRSFDRDETPKDALSDRFDRVPEKEREDQAVDECECVRRTQSHWH